MPSNHRTPILKLSLVIALAIAASLPASALGANADLSIAKQDSADPVQVGAELTYSITVANAGPDAANGVKVTDKLPNSVDLLAAAASQGACDAKGRNVTCELGAVANAGTAVVTIRVKPTKDGTIENTATVSSTDTDSYKPNDSDTEVTTVTPGPAAPTCGGKEATIVGTVGADALVGTTKADVIVALGGDDSIDGLGGNDLVCGSAGNDTLRGKAGNDVLRAGGGNDQVRGGGGSDTLRGGGGDDRLAGGAGDDVCRGGGGSDTERSC